MDIYPEQERAADERAALARLTTALGIIREDLKWYWHWGDGRGGWLIYKIMQLAEQEGFLPVSQSPISAGGKRPIPRSLRKLVFERDAYRCRHCDGYVDLCCDHVIPESKGGPTTLDNLQTLCRSCNSRKGAKVAV
jgi:hypothetical protein